MRLEVIPQTKIAILNNRLCPYCGVELDENAGFDDVIGRKFVPTGKLHGSWNLKLRACDRCNNRKSDLEDDISAISMQPDVLGRFAVNDEALVAEARRKAGRSKGRRTRRAVATSTETIKLNYTLGPGPRCRSRCSARPR